MACLMWIPCSGISAREQTIFAHWAVHDQPVIRTEEALLQLANWIESCQASYPDAQLVTRDHDFDLAILADKYEKLGIPIPWKYWAAKSHRTREDDLRWMQKLLGLGSVCLIPSSPECHTMQDAVSQVNTVRCTSR
jgi:hypothetical protein